MSDQKPLGKRDPDASAPDLESVDQSWDDEDLDEDATTVARIPKELLARSRMKDNEPPKEEAPPEKHEAITARPPPMAADVAEAGSREASVVIDAPHEKIADGVRPPKDDEDDDEDEEEEDEEEELDADAIDAGWGEEEAKAVAADVAAGLDEAARRKAAEERAKLRKEKARNKTLAARERRKAKAEAQRAKQKQKKKRSLPPRASNPPASARAQSGEAAPTSRERPTVPPKADAVATRSSAPLAPAAPRDWVRMALICAIIVVLGALVIGLARR